VRGLASGHAAFVFGIAVALVLILAQAGLAARANSIVEDQQVCSNRPVNFAQLPLLFDGGLSAPDLARTMELLRQLIASSPGSPYSSEALSLLDLQTEFGHLQSDISERVQQVEDLAREVERLKQASALRDAQIRVLREELQRLKRIDMQRRPVTLRP
jgi:peptidoglycan hydrolase CwlO-like protein